MTPLHVGTVEDFKLIRFVAIVDVFTRLWSR